MKKKLIMILVACSMVATPLAQAMASTTPIMASPMKDKPALNKLQNRAFHLIKANLLVASASLGVLGGIFLWNLGFFKYRTGPTRTEPITQFFGMTDEVANRGGFTNSIESGGEVLANFPLYLAKVGIIGILARYPLQKIVLTKTFAYWYSVSYSIAKVCLYYNINANQYRKILKAAASRNKDAMMQAIQEIYPKRFGSDWRNRMKTIFSTYKEQALTLVKRGSFDEKLSDDERDFVRMIELGAAMANLYYGTQPRVFKKWAIDSALKLYKELGIL